MAQSTIPFGVPRIAPASSEVLARLHRGSAQRRLVALAQHLDDLSTLVALDMAAFERTYDELAFERGLVGHTARHLVRTRGKRLRPMCVLLASRVQGGACTHAAHDLAVAAELVHAATLLHDDVVDLGDERRGTPTARSLYGNAASVFAGDWLLVEALRRVRSAGIPGALDRVLDVIQCMVHGESVQLEIRGNLSATREQYFEVAHGKTAALFAWALYVGGRAGGLDEASSSSLEGYGTHLGIAFQAIDDVLDLVGDASLTGKSLLADVREGKMTLPLIVALERDPTIATSLEAVSSADTDEPIPEAHASAVVEAVTKTGALETCREIARGHAEQAAAHLDDLPPGRARDALLTLVAATVSRQV